MALTSHCDIFASLTETAFSNVVRNVARQRPSLFNYGTASFVAAPKYMCHPIETSPGLPGTQPRVTLENGVVFEIGARDVAILVTLGEKAGTFSKGRRPVSIRIPGRDSDSNPKAGARNAA